MSTALYRRYRPDSFEQVIGQDHVTVPLRAALRANKVTHAYLFSGPRGCGKTTSARILARCLNCAKGPTDTPCGTCDSCRELATGGPGSLDVVEIDAASHGGVDDARELRERATFAPVRDRYKVFIIDEAHMVTQAGFNALLKLVEEPPEHVKFVFATTEPDKVLGTIRSRTHHYPFRLVPPDVLEPYLAQLSAEEGIDIAPGVLNLVIRAGGGSVRDTLSVLDQLMAGAVDGHLPYAQAVALLGYTDVALLDESVDALAGGDGAAVYRVVERMVDSGHDPRRFVEDLLQRLRDLLIIAVAGEGASDVLTGVPADQMERMVTQARNWGSRALSRAADLTDQALRAMVGATSPRLQLELLIGRILVPAPEPTSQVMQGTVGLAGGGAPHERSSQPQTGQRTFGATEAKEHLRAMRAEKAAGAGAHKPAPQENNPAAPPAGAPQASASWDVPVAQPGGTSTLAPSSSQSLAAEPSSAPTQPESAQNGQVTHENMDRMPPAPTSSSGGAQADMLRQRWPEVIDRLSSISRVAWALLNGNGQLGGVDAQQAVIVLPTQGMVDNFVHGQRGSAVEQAIYEATGLRLSVSAQVGQARGGAAVTTPTAPASQLRNEASNSASSQSLSTGELPAHASYTLSEHSTPTPEPAIVITPPEPENLQAPHPAGEAKPTAVTPGEPTQVRESFKEPAQTVEPHGGASALEQHSDHVSVFSDAYDAPTTSDVMLSHEEAGAGSKLTPGIQAETRSTHLTSKEGVQDETEIAWPAPAVIPHEEAPRQTPAPEQTMRGWVAPEPDQAPSEQEQRPETVVVPDPAVSRWASTSTAEWGHFSDVKPQVTFEDEQPEENDAPPTRFAVVEGQGVAAADDDSASIDDEDVEVNSLVGLSAVEQILGGRVIEERTEESKW